MGIVPYGSGEEISSIPSDSGPFRFVSAEPDKEVVIERNDAYWGEKAEVCSGCDSPSCSDIYYAGARIAQRQRRCCSQLANRRHGSCP